MRCILIKAKLNFHLKVLESDIAKEF